MAVPRALPYQISLITLYMQIIFNFFFRVPEIYFRNAKA